MLTPLYPKITTNKPLLRLGVMLDNWMVPNWIAEVLATVKNSGIAEFSTVILNRVTSQPQTNWDERQQEAPSGRSAGLRTLLWHRYLRMDRRRNPSFAGPFQPHNVRPPLANAKIIEVMPLPEGRTHRFTAADIAVIRRDDLDVILRFGFGILRGDILSAATYGVWSYHHADNNVYRGGPAGFWEMYERNSLTGTILQVLTEEIGGGAVIYRSYGATSSFDSLLVNRYWLYRKAIPFVARCLRRVYEHGRAGMCAEAQAPAYTRRLYRTPGNGQMLLFLMRIEWRRLIVRIQQRLCIEPDHWFLGVARGVAPGQQLANHVAALHPPKGRFWADPMIARRDGRTFVFFEDYDYGLQRGSIAVIEIDAGLRASAPQIVLQADHHLSYPFVFEWRGEHFMVPETANMRAVRLFRAAEFPTRWEYVQDLLSGIRAADATLCEHEARWYLFTSVSEAGGSSWEELFLFVSVTPMGPWAPHPMNPIVSDVRGARPGGALFQHDGVLYRPGQNSEKAYGQSLAVFEVTKLTPERYAERFAYRIEPDWLPRIHGCHTITMADDLLVLDCKAVRWRP